MNSYILKKIEELELAQSWNDQFRLWSAIKRQVELENNVSGKKAETAWKIATNFSGEQNYRNIVINFIKTIPLLK